MLALINLYLTINMVCTIRPESFVQRLASETLAYSTDFTGKKQFFWFSFCFSDVIVCGVDLLIRFVEIR